MAEHTPLSPGEFARLLDRLGPFERSPTIAVAVSGGADSLALAILADGWAREKRGRVVALTVDHGLRPNSTDEARQVGIWLRVLGIDHHILTWEANKPVTGIQAAARTARHALLLEWCRQAGVVHLLMAHQRDDQIETLLLRIGRGSGVDGLAGMAPVVERRHARILRPLLTVPRARLVALLVAKRHPWVDDPSNQDLRYGRARLRNWLARQPTEDLPATGIAASARRLARARRSLEMLTNSHLAKWVMLHPAGFAHCERALLSGPDEIVIRSLARVLFTVSGAAYAPRQESVERLLGSMRGGGAGWTLGGCQILVKPSGILVCREAAAIAQPVPLRISETVWDGRYCAQLGGFSSAGFRLGRLGETVGRELVSRCGHPAQTGIPARVRSTLPAIFDDHGVFAVPHLGYIRGDAGLIRGDAGLAGSAVVFRPRAALSVVRRCLV